MSLLKFLLDKRKMKHHPVHHVSFGDEGCMGILKEDVGGGRVIRS